MIPVIPAPFFTYSNKELTFDNSLYIFFLPLMFVYQGTSLIFFVMIITS